MIRQRSWLSYFSHSFSDEIVNKIGSNVFRGAYNELSNDFLMQMDGAIIKEEAIGIFNYLVLFKVAILKISYFLHSLSKNFCTLLKNLF